MLKNNSKVRLEVKGYYHEFTTDKMNELKEVAANKLGIQKKDIEIEKRYIQNESKDSKNVSEVVLDSVLNPEKLQKNYEKFINTNYPEFSFDDFMKIEKEVSKLLPSDMKEFDTRDRKYEVLYLKGKNIFSYGEFERHFSNKGLTLIHSEKPYGNAGGKSSLVRMLAFLLYGRKLKYGHKNANYPRVFNKFSEDDYAFVEGEIKINDEIYFLKREITYVSPKTAKHKFHIYKYDDKGKEVDILGGKRAINLKVKDAVKTLKEFEKTIGSYEDYVFAAYYEYHNIEKWLETKPTERYRLFCEYLGLGLIERKYQIAKNLYNDHLSSSVSKMYNSEGLAKEIEELEEEIDSNNNLINIKRKEVGVFESVIKSLNSKVKEKYTKRHSIDSKFESYDLSDNQKSLLNIEKAIQIELSELSNLEVNLKGYSVISNADKKIANEKSKELKSSLNSIEKPEENLLEIKRLEEAIDNVKTPKNLQLEIGNSKSRLEDLKAAQSASNYKINAFKQEHEDMPNVIECSNCGNVEDTSDKKQALLDKISDEKQLVESISDEIITVEDNLKDLKNKRNVYLENEISNLRAKIKEQDYIISQEVKKRQQDIYASIEECNEIINKYNDFEYLKLEISKKQQLIKSKQAELKYKQEEIDQYLANQDKVKHNKEVAEEIYKLELTIEAKNQSIGLLSSEINEIEKEVNLANFKIEKNRELIEELRVDSNREKLLKLYLNVHSDSGISKHIILSILPQINTELALLFNEMNMDFELSIKFDNKAIEFTVTKSGVEQDLNDYSGYETTVSCLAIHYINMKMTTLPVPNYLILDEILGRTTNDNFDKIKLVLDKLTDIFDYIDVVTHSHSEELLEKIEHDVFIRKVNNISEIVYQK